jgi:ketosteroid isomerase-like protein
MRRLLLGSMLAALAAATAGGGEPPDLPAEVAATLDRFHRAAAEADGATYFSLFAEDAVFLGTAPGERWTLEAFRAFAEPYFERGSGWTYVAREGRFVGVSRDGSLAWFDEVLDNAKYGRCRGTGVLRREAAGWRIVQYNLMLPVPNEITLDLVKMIAEMPSD